MKKFLMMSCVAMLLALCGFVFAACGSGDADSTRAGTSPSGPTEPDAASVAERTALFTGEWKLAALKMDDLTMAGDFSQVLGSSEGSVIVLNEDGTGTFDLAGNAADVTWKVTGQRAASIVVTGEEGSGEVKAIVKDGVMSLRMESDQASSSTLLYSHDGIIESAPRISAADATPITSLDGLVGEWKIAGNVASGMTATGPPKSLSALMGQSDPINMTIEEDGTTTILGDTVEVVITDDGAVLEADGVQIPVRAYGEDIMFDATELFGTESILVFSR